MKNLQGSKLTTTELGMLVGLSRPTITKMVKSGNIPESCIRRTKGGGKYSQLRFLNNRHLKAWITRMAGDASYREAVASIRNKDRSRHKHRRGSLSRSGFGFISHITWLRQRLRVDLVGKFSLSDRRILKDELKPIVEFYNAI